MLKNALKMMSIAVAGVMLFSLTACGGASAPKDAKPAVASTPAAKTEEKTEKKEEKVKLKIYTQYSNDDEKQPYDYAVAALKKEMPNVELELEIEAQDDNQKIKTYAASGNLPDIFKVTTDLIQIFKKNNNLLLLDPYVKELGIEEKLLPTSLPLLKDGDGHTYAVPNVGQWAATLYYNKEIFEKNNIKVPANYPEFLEAVKALKAKDILPMTLFLKEKWPAVQLIDMIATREEAAGLQKIDAGKGSISEEAYKKAAAKVVELVKAGLISKDAFNTNYDQACEMFMSGKAAMISNGAWGMGMYGAKDKLGDKVDLLYYPFADPGKEDACKWNMSGGGFNQGFAANANSKNKDIAGKYACSMALKFAEGRVVKRADPNPIMKGAPQPESGYNSVQQRYVKDSANFKTMTCFPWGLTNPKFKVAVEDNAHSLFTGSMTVEKFVENIANAMK